MLQHLSSESKLNAEIALLSWPPWVLALPPPLQAINSVLRWPWPCPVEQDLTRSSRHLGGSGADKYCSISAPSWDSGCRCQFAASAQRLQQIKAQGPWKISGRPRALRSAITKNTWPSLALMWRILSSSRAHGLQAEQIGFLLTLCAGPCAVCHVVHA